VAGQVRGGAPLKTAARNLKPNADDNIGPELYVLYPQSFLVDRLRQGPPQDVREWFARLSEHVLQILAASSIQITAANNDRTRFLDLLLTHSGLA
jgi:hypothetical protein